MKSLAVFAILLLAACDGTKPAPERSGNTNEAAAVAPAVPSATAEPDDGKVECALAGDPEFRRECTIERRDEVGGRVLTLIGPGGGFRRLRITRDGRGVIAADGAERARVTIISPERIEVAIGRDRYRLPATVKS